MSKYRHHTKDIWSIAKRALDGDHRRVSPYLTTWNVAGTCEAPVTVELSGRGYRDVVDPQHHTAAGIDLDVRCRRCAKCLRARASMWTAKALQECRTHPRTWFGTLTLHPTFHHDVTLRACQIAALNGDDFDAFEEDEKYAARHAIVSREITRFLKRTRKEANTAFRYLLVAEAHKSGLPHYHLLLHEPEGEAPVRKRVLEKQWKWGFSSWRLSEPRRAVYVCKYLAKCSNARVRASLHYGQHALSVNSPASEWISTLENCGMTTPKKETFIGTDQWA